MDHFHSNIFLIFKMYLLFELEVSTNLYNKREKSWRVSQCLLTLLIGQVFSGKMDIS